MLQISFEPGFGAYQGLASEKKSGLFQDFLLISAVLRVRGRFQNPRQTPVRTKLRLKRFPKMLQIAKHLVHHCEYAIRIAKNIANH